MDWPLFGRPINLRLLGQLVTRLAKTMVAESVVGQKLVKRMDGQEDDGKISDAFSRPFPAKRRNKAQAAGRQREGSS